MQRQEEPEPTQVRYLPAELLNRLTSEQLQLVQESAGRAAQ